MAHWLIHCGVHCYSLDSAEVAAHTMLTQRMSLNRAATQTARALLGAIMRVSSDGLLTDALFGSHPEGRGADHTLQVGDGDHREYRSLRLGTLLQALIITIEPGGSSQGAREHIGEEAGYVIEGEFELILDGISYRLVAADSFNFRSERPHAYRNPGKRPTKLIWVNTPPTDHREYRSLRLGTLLQALIITIEPGGSSQGAREHIGEEAGYIIEGEFELILDGISYRLVAADSFNFRSERPHAYRNPGKRPTKLIWVNTSPTL
jgi:uncharacterized cupin superfamily protein